MFNKKVIFPETFSCERDSSVVIGVVVVVLVGLVVLGVGDVGVGTEFTGLVVAVAVRDGSGVGLFPVAVEAVSAAGGSLGGGSEGGSAAGREAVEGSRHVVLSGGSDHRQVSVLKKSGVDLTRCHFTKIALKGLGSIPGSAKINKLLNKTYPTDINAIVN